MLKACYTVQAGVPLSFFHVFFSFLPLQSLDLFAHSVVQQGAASLEFACCKFVQGHAQQRPCWAAFVIPAVNNEDNQQASTE